jgi:hypothetical protein
VIPVTSHFHPDNRPGYEAWREHKLRDYPAHASELIVEVENPRKLTPSEHDALQARCRKTGMAVYATPCGNDPDKGIMLEIGHQLGLHRLDANYLADEDAISTLTVAEEGQTKGEFIPYTNRPIRWHTDGYYNVKERRIKGMTLHCVRPAESGGENHLLDHEIAYMLLRDENPEFIRVLMQEDVMTIPPREDETGVARAAESGPVFDVLEGGQLYMRYTARTKSISWKQDEATRSALSALEGILASDLPFMFENRLEAGMGLLCNNVLHDRTAFIDNPDAPRTLYRGRYYDRISNT